MSFVTILTAWVGRTFPVHPAFTYASMALSAYPLLICAFRYSINEMCYSKHESPLLYVATANGVLSYVTFQGGTLVTLAIALVLTLASYRFAVIGPVPKDVDMKGRVCIVTGSSSGIGQATAQALVRMGAHVILGARPARSRGAAGSGRGPDLLAAAHARPALAPPSRPTRAPRSVPLGEEGAAGAG